MEQTFATRQVVWAKVKGYPWWPAKIIKLPSSDAQVFKVEFIAQDTHAFLNPRDVKKYEEHYDQYSKKKMRGLAPAIQTADEMHRKRIQALIKVPVSQPTEKKTKITKPSPKKKTIKRMSRKRAQQSPQSSDQSQSQGQCQVEVEPEEKEQPVAKEESEMQSEDNDEEERFLNESQERVDRNKIQAIEQKLLKVTQKVKDGHYTFHKDDFQGLDLLSGEQVLASKITNMLAFISSQLTKQQKLISRENLQFLEGIRNNLKQKAVEYLYDSSYYDQYIRLIQKNKKSRNQYEGKLAGHLKTQHRLKKQLSSLFASRLVAQINNGTISRYKDLLEDIKERKIDLTSVTNKAAVDRSIESLIPKYM